MTSSDLLFALFLSAIFVFLLSSFFRFFRGEKAVVRVRESFAECLCLLRGEFPEFFVYTCGIVLACCHSADLLIFLGTLYHFHGGKSSGKCGNFVRVFPLASFCGKKRQLCADALSKNKGAGSPGFQPGLRPPPCTHAILRTRVSIISHFQHKVNNFSLFLSLVCCTALYMASLF